jgi:hypothetical protein
MKLMKRYKKQKKKIKELKLDVAYYKDLLSGSRRHNKMLNHQLKLALDDKYRRSKVDKLIGKKGDIR